MRKEWVCKYRDASVHMKFTQVSVRCTWECIEHEFSCAICYSGLGIWGIISERKGNSDTCKATLVVTVFVTGNLTMKILLLVNSEHHHINTQTFRPQRTRTRTIHNMAWHTLPDMVNPVNWKLISCPLWYCLRWVWHSLSSPIKTGICWGSEGGVKVWGRKKCVVWVCCDVHVDRMSLRCDVVCGVSVAESALVFRSVVLCVRMWCGEGVRVDRCSCGMVCFLPKLHPCGPSNWTANFPLS